VAILWVRGAAGAAFVPAAAALAAEEEPEPLFTRTLETKVPPIASDPTVRYDYDIIYVRARRAGDEVHKRFYTDFSQPVTLEPGADLMLLRPDGTEDLLAAGGKGSITDPMVSFDGEWVYYTLLHDLERHDQWSPPAAGADIFKIHVASRRLVRLTNQRFSPNTGAARWSRDYRIPQAEGRETGFDYGVFNMGPCPLPGARVVFTSNRDGFRPAKGYPAIALQLFVMDDREDSLGDGEDPRNIEKIGHLNISGALHPIVLADGRILFSTLESQGIRSDISWGVWTIHPDGTRWAPFVSAFDPGGAPNGFHFQTQLGDGSVIIEEYYNQNNSGFGAYIKAPPAPPSGYPAFGPAHMHDPRNKPWRYGRFANGKGEWYRMPFMPAGAISLTPFTHGREGPADPSVAGDESSPRVGKFTHPSGAPDNHLLTIYSPGPVNHQYRFLPQLDGGIYLVKSGEVVEEPGAMLLIKNDPAYNESWPRALVPYERIYGKKEPARLEPLANDGALSPHLPAGTPFGLVGTSSLYKRESYPDGAVREGSVTAAYKGGRDAWRGLDAFTSHGNGMPLNWHNQGGDAGLYENADIHAVRILAMEPTTDRRRGADHGRRFFSHAEERLRILGEIPVRKFTAPEGDGDGEEGAGKEPLDPDGNPDTSFLARIPADTAFTFQTIDRHGMVLNMAQTWHQLRPGEIRTDCGGCHAHSQAPTPFEKTLAARADYPLWDLVAATPLITTRERDESGRTWDAARAAGLRSVPQGVVSVEYHRDVRPILERSCVPCHTREAAEPPGNLVLDADRDEADLVEHDHHGRFPGTYYRLALDEAARFGHKPIGYDTWGYPNASRYIRKLQSRRSLLVWKVFGRRLDGFGNDDHPSPAAPGDREKLVQGGEPVDLERNRHAWDLDFTGTAMPPPRAVAEGKVPPLSDEDRFTLVRWIDLGSPIDLDWSPEHPERRGRGWMLDDNRPVLALSLPLAGRNRTLERIIVGMNDYYTGIDPASFRVTADFPLAGAPPGEDLAARFEERAPGVRELRLAAPVRALARGTITVTVKDREGNLSRIERTFSVAGEGE
jgi:hypothetical protein